MTTTLYTLAEESLEIARILEETQGELTPELESRLDELMSGSEEKLESAAYVVRMLENHAEEIRLEAQRLAVRRVSFENQAEALKERMQIVLDSVYGGRLKTAKNTLWTQVSPDTVLFDVYPGVDLSTLPEEYVRTKRELNKLALRESWDAAEELPEGILAMPSPGRRSLRIK